MKYLLFLLFLLPFHLSFGQTQAPATATVQQTEEYALLNMVYLGKLSYILVQAGAEAPEKRSQRAGLADVPDERNEQPQRERL